MSKKNRHITIAVVGMTLFILTICAVVIYGFFTKENMKRDIPIQATIKDMPEEKTSQVEEKVNKESTKKLTRISSPKSKNEETITNQTAKTKSNTSKSKTQNVKVESTTKKATQNYKVSSRNGDVKTNNSTATKTEPKTTAKVKEKTKSVNNANSNKTSDSGLVPKYKGHTTIGKIQIPKTGVNLNILKNQTVEGMEIAACLIYKTGELNESGNNVIVAHNYRNGKLFSNNNKLNVGDKIYITTLDGKKVTYTIYKKFVTTPEDVSFYKRKTDGPEITLSTCSNDEKTRIVILAK